MVLGYDEPRPKKENYESFIDRFTSGLKIFGQKEISFMIYGSYVRGEADFGRSDIDGVLVFPDNVVTNKKIMAEISRIVAVAQENNNIPFQTSPVDLRTMSDGRFNSYDPNFESYFEEESKILFGLDYRRNFKFELAEHSDQTAIRFNLRRARIGLLTSEQTIKENYPKFLEGFNQTLNSVSRGSKQILGLIDGRLRINRFSALEEISKIFPQVDAAPLKKIKYLFKNLRELDEIYKHSGEVINIWNSSLTFFEQIIKAYLDANPRIQ
ncbi:MAG: nucleotidyltransferase domain-containing protein [Nanoarchaeota archaeon]